MHDEADEHQQQLDAAQGNCDAAWVEYERHKRAADAAMAAYVRFRCTLDALRLQVIREAA